MALKARWSSWRGRSVLAALGVGPHFMPTMRPRVFYGWFVVAGAFTVTCVGFGSAYTFSAFVGSLQTEFAASRGSVSLVFSLADFCTSLSVC